MMDQMHFLILLVLSSITFCMCMPNGNSGDSDHLYAIRMIKDFSEEQITNMVAYLLHQKKENRTVLNILPDLHRMYPGNTELYFMGGLAAWHLNHPERESPYSCDYSYIRDKHMLEFLERSIRSGDYNTVRIALPILEKSEELAGEHLSKSTPLLNEMIDRMKAIRVKVDKWIEEKEQNKQVVQTDTSELIPK